MLKVLFLSTLYAPNFLGGAERVVQSVAEGITEAGHRPVVISTVPHDETRRDRANGVKVYYVGQKNVYYWPPRGKDDRRGMLKPLWHGLDTYNPWMAREVGRILDVERPDLVHTGGLAGFSALAWKPVKRRGLPLVHTLFDYYLLCPRSTMFRDGGNCEKQCAGCRVYSLPRSRLSNLVDVVVGNSRFVLERHLELGCFAATPERRVIYNAYRAEPTTPGPERRSSLPIRFGYLGRLHPTKGLEMVLDSAGRLPAGSWSLKIGGEGPAAYEKHLRANYGTLAVEFLGRIEPDPFFAEIDVLVVPSLWHDPSPRVVSEAYANGVPVIGSKRGGIPELIEDARTGFLFDPGHPGDLTTKMQRYIAKPALVADMRVACLERAESFPPEGVVERYLEAYASAIRSTR